MRDMWKKCQMIQRITVGIACLTVLLPILFWKYIPAQIPQHYNGAGIVDAWSDKSVLVLLFFVILFLLGMMSVVTYFLKTSGLSQNASESERQTSQRLYPAIVIMNLMLQLMFSYMVFCAATCRNLGKYFLVIVLVLVFAPLAWYFIDASRNATPDKKQKRLYLEQEKKEEGIVYRTRVDLWLAVLLLLPIVLETGALVEGLLKGEIRWFILGTLLFIAVMIVPLCFMRYVLYQDYILVTCGIFGKERIPYAGITKMKKTNNPLSSAAMSLRRIQIDYVANGRHEMALISPKDRDAFLAEVEKRIALQGKEHL